MQVFLNCNVFVCILIVNQHLKLFPFILNLKTCRFYILWSFFFQTIICMSCVLDVDVKNLCTKSKFYLGAILNFFYSYIFLYRYWWVNDVAWWVSVVWQIICCFMYSIWVPFLNTISTKSMIISTLWCNNPFVSLHWLPCIRNKINRLTLS